MRDFKLTIFIAASLLALFLLPACIIDDVALEETDVFECASDEDCIENFECINSRCMEKGIIDVDCADNDNDGVNAGEGCIGITDCNDADNTIYPDAPELCDLKDNDCDDVVDEDVSISCPLAAGVCGEANAAQSCVEGALVPATCDANCPGENCIYGPDYVLEEGAAESSDGKDNDCDGNIDEEKQECVAGESCGMSSPCNGAVDISQCACKTGTQQCNPDGSKGECLDSTGQPVILPFSQVETCGNGIDDTCEGQIDEGC